MNGHVCINPAHYEPADHDCILDALIDFVSCLGIYPACRRVVAVVSLRQALGPEATFHALCDVLRMLVFTPGQACPASSNDSQSSDDAASPAAATTTTTGAATGAAAGGVSGAPSAPPLGSGRAQLVARRRRQHSSSSTTRTPVQAPASP